MVADKPATMICALGGQPQVVIFTLAALLAWHVPIVRLFSPENKCTQKSLDKLAAEFNNGRYRERPLRYYPYSIRANGSLPVDIYDETDAHTAWDAINQLVRELKKRQRPLHVCISDGRCILVWLTLSAATLYFGHQDAPWHMYTPDTLRQAAAGGAMMRAPVSLDLGADDALGDLFSSATVVDPTIS